MAFASPPSGFPPTDNKAHGIFFDGIQVPLTPHLAFALQARSAICRETCFSSR
jgi:hypothetical protein